MDDRCGLSNGVVSDEHARQDRILGIGRVPGVAFVLSSAIATFVSNTISCQLVTSFPPRGERILQRNVPNRSEKAGLTNTSLLLLRIFVATFCCVFPANWSIWES
jgi:hypothetical protein